MSCSFPDWIILLCFLRIPSVSAQSFPFLPGFDFPELDGSAVDESCRIFIVNSSDEPPTTSTPRAETRTSPTSWKVVTTTQKPTVHSSPWEPVTKTPIQTRPAPSGTDHQARAALTLLHYLLANSRRRVASSQPMGGLGVKSSSDESGGVWRVGAVSSEDSSDES